MAAWSNGYVADIPYTYGFFRRMAPAQLRLAALTCGHGAPPTDRVAYAELGCGQGFGTVLLAAANPDADIYGFDFNPEQVAHAQRLGDKAGLSNLHLRDLSFEELAELPLADLPEFDMVTLHGVYSWISPHARAAVTTFLRRKLKPGGLVYISYNAMPGCAAVQPLQRLVRAEAARAPGTSDARARAGVAFAARLAEKGFAFLKDSPSVMRRLGHHENQSGAYLAHEYLNADWTLFYLEDVATELDAAKLVFVGSGRLAENDLRLSVPAELQEFFRGIEDPIRRETLKDYWANRSFRVDVFQKGSTRPGREDLIVATRAQRVSLRKPADAVDLTFPVGSGKMEGRREVFEPLLDRLSAGPATIGELEVAARGRADLPTLLRMIILLDATDQLGAARLASPDPEPARRLNQVLAQSWNGPYRFVAAPELGGALEASSDDLLLLGLVLAGVEASGEALAMAAFERLTAMRKVVRGDDSAATDHAAQMGILRERAGRFVDAVLPVWRNAGIVGREVQSGTAAPRLTAVG
ncbi:class I SAM-dependent methyltransferase [Salinarimonas soli]|uniref:Methyltransferase domain-containing protein n=1 Tax=Salinarimonas soli TaxID=1638099 RepID=A0A5B2W0Y1_9HYPH|nr:class I SAM-dependent methyltransferase [Salinarimonas soli]KAA2243919.1 methyltransferase domain-containing protein [Salinarimonas soli]